MAGKFTDITYKKTMDSMVNTVQEVLKNPHYLFTDQKGTKVDYYTIHRDRSTLDEDSSLHYQTVGNKSGFKYNVIRDLFIFGLEKVQLNLDVGEVGTEADQIEGDAIILPNTIEPADGDCFVITYLKEPIIFRVNTVNIDTLDNDSNIYKINYRILDNRESSIADLEKQVIDEYRFIPKNIGTQFKPIIKSTEFDLIEALEDLLEEITGYFKGLFFKDEYQTFVYKNKGKVFHDPYMIEFCIRNKIFRYGSKYTFITQQVNLPSTFSLDYTKSIFYYIEEKDKTRANPRLTSGMTRIEDLHSLFYYSATDCYLVDYTRDSVLQSSFVEIFSQELLDRIQTESYYSCDDKMFIYNLLIAYFNNDRDYIKTNVLEVIRKFDIQDNTECFYGLIFSIFVLSHYIENTLK